MDVEVTIRYSVSEYPADDVNEAVANLLNASLPFMVDNVEIHFDTQEG